MPLPVIRTERLVLRPWSRGDIDSLHALWTTPEVRRYLWDDVQITRDVCEESVVSLIQTADQHGVGCWALQLAPPVSPVAPPIAGFCGFRFMDATGDIELMYGLTPEHWGMGLATESCEAALAYVWGSTQFPRVYARTDPPNVRSIQVMRRLGMTNESNTASTVTYMLRRPVRDRHA